MDGAHRRELRPGVLPRVQHGGRTRWRGQDLGDAEVLVVGDAAVLRTVVTDTIDRADGTETYRMPMTQFWVRTASGWRCLAGHAGPRLIP